MTIAPDKELSICIIAGEASGDVLGGRLMRELNKQAKITWIGVGGSMMQEQGLRSQFPMEKLSIMGLFEVLPKIPEMLDLIDIMANKIAYEKPDIVITIDAPDFCKRVVKKARKKGARMPFVHYVAPTVWAWREGRAKTMAGLFDGLMCLFPFEPDYFTPYHLKAKCVGHPIIETYEDQDTQIENEPSPFTFCVLFGSRKSEILRTGEVFAETVSALSKRYPQVEFLVPTFPELRPMISDYLDSDVTVKWVKPESRYKAFMMSDAALAVSGTAGLELAVYNVPHAIGYKMSPMTYKLAKKLIKVPYAHLANIIAGREIVPEFIQEKCSADALIRVCSNLIDNDSMRQTQIDQFAAIREQLHGADITKTPSQQAGEFVLSFIK